MSNSEQDATAHLLILGCVSKLLEPDRQRVQKCAKQIRQSIAEAGELGPVALALVGAERVAKEKI